MSVTLTAATVLAQNQYTTTDFDLTDVEYMIDDCIDTVNALTNDTIAALSGDAGSKSVTITRSEAPSVKTLITIVLREAKKTSLSNSSSTGNSTGTSSSINVGSIGMSESGSVSSAISATSALNNTAGSPLVDLFYKLIDVLKEVILAETPSLKSPPIYVGNAPISSY